MSVGSGVNMVTVSTVFMSMINYTRMAESMPAPGLGKRVYPLQSTQGGTPTHGIIGVPPPKQLWGTPLHMP